jgi:archaemetzincin
MRVKSKMMKNLAFLFMLVLCHATLFCTEPEIVVALQPLGEINDTTIETVKNGIVAVYRVEVVVLTVKELPESAYYEPRRRYRADILLDYLNKETDKRFTKVLGLTNRDISATKGEHYDWGIFGYGTLGGRPCIVSTHRLRRGNASRALFMNRLIKVVNHELGHTFGLDHCPVEGCLMQDGKGTIRTVDSESGDFCPRCRERLKKILRVVNR